MYVCMYYVRMYVYMFICTYACMYVRMYVDIFVCMHVGTYVCILCLCVCMYLRMYGYMCTVYVRISVSAYMDMWICVPTHVYLDIYGVVSESANKCPQATYCICREDSFVFDLKHKPSI